MIDFKQIKITDKEIIDLYFNKVKSTACDYCFTNLFIWQYHYDHQYAIVEDFLVVKTFENDKTAFWFPVGDGDLLCCIGRLIEYTKQANIPLEFTRVTEEQSKQLIALYHDQIVITEDRDSFDYLYRSEDLISLKGKKYHQKRNHINRFIENNWTFEPITPDNADECISFNNRWCEDNNDDNDGTNEDKHLACAVCLALKNLDRLGLVGGLLRLDGEIVAISAGGRLSDDTFVVHIEKAKAEIQGAYPTINREFARFAASNFLYINREEDLGIEGLRKAKLSYNPYALVVKYNVVINHD